MSSAAITKRKAIALLNFQKQLLITIVCVMLGSLPLRNMVNTSSQLETSIRYHFHVALPVVN